MPALTYSVHVDGDQMFVSTPGGAGGYLVKRVKPDRLLEPILKVANRSELMTEDFLLRVKYYFQELLQLPSGHDNSALAKLTRREQEVLELLSKGCVDKEIAQAMGISVWTVHGHIKKIFERLHVRTRTKRSSGIWKSNPIRLPFTANHTRRKRTPSEPLPPPQNGGMDAITNILQSRRMNGAHKRADVGVDLGNELIQSAFNRTT